MAVNRVRQAAPVKTASLPNPAENLPTSRGGYTVRDLFANINWRNVAGGPSVRLRSAGTRPPKIEDFFADIRWD